MKKKLTILGLLAVGFANAQESEYYGRVGINTETPHATLNVETNEQTDAFIVGRNNKAEGKESIILGVDNEISPTSVYSINLYRDWTYETQKNLFIIGNNNKTTRANIIGNNNIGFHGYIFGDNNQHKKSEDRTKISAGFIIGNNNISDDYILDRRPYIFGENLVGGEYQGSFVIGRQNKKYKKEDYRFHSLGGGLPERRIDNDYLFFVVGNDNKNLLEIWDTGLFKFNQLDSYRHRIMIFGDNNENNGFHWVYNNTLFHRDNNTTKQYLSVHNITEDDTKNKIPHQEIYKIGDLARVHKYANDKITLNQEGFYYSYMGQGKWGKLVPVLFETTFPTEATAGDLFFHTSEKKYYFYNGTEWVSMGGN